MQTSGKDRLLKAEEVSATTALGASSIYLLMQDADPELRFPKPVKIGQRSCYSAWNVDPVSGVIGVQC